MIAWPHLANPGAAAQLFSQLSAMARPDYVMQGFPEYATDPSALDAANRNVLLRAATAIVRSQSTLNPVRAVIVVGHADRALRKTPGERPAFELQVSRQRAESASSALRREVLRLSEGAHFAKTLRIGAVGLGSTRRVSLNPTTEAEMRKNRRVEIVLATTPLAGPRCGV